MSIPMAQYYIRLCALCIALSGLCEAKEFDFRSYIDKILCQPIADISKNENLRMIGYGGGMAYDLKTIATYFVTLEPITVEEARNKYVYGTQTLMNKINENRKIRPYLHDFPFTHANMEFRIAYHGNNPMYESFPYIRFMYAAKGKLLYDSIDPNTGKFVTIHSETYEEALNIVQGKDG